MSPAFLFNLVAIFWDINTEESSISNSLLPLNKVQKSLNLSSFEIIWTVVEMSLLSIFVVTARWSSSYTSLTPFKEWIWDVISLDLAEIVAS